jgi:aspartyl-tRNA(Asn)/glutamyl-tRNA(Gln) amidotransferase subunit C
MAIREEDVRRIATLARLRLSEDETRALAGDLSRILEYVDKLSSLDTTSVEPTSHVVAVTSAWREDTLPDRNDQTAADEAVANAPRRDGHFFAVPPIIE